MSHTQGQRIAWTVPEGRDNDCWDPYFVWGFDNRQIAWKMTIAHIWCKELAMAAKPLSPPRWRDSVTGAPDSLTRKT